MARPARPRSAPVATLQARTQQLLDRDPMLAALKSVPELSNRSKEQQQQARNLEVLLSSKYGAAVFPWPSPAGLANYQTRGEDFSARYLPAQDLNAEPPGPLVPGGDTFLTRRPGPIHPLLATDPARFRVLVRLDLVTEHDIERLARQFRAGLKWCLRQAGGEQHALRWLRTVAPAVFNRDLRRYDLHIRERLTFRQIAYLEQIERRRGRPPTPAQLYGKTISIAPEAESSVRAAVVRIYESIHRLKYHARRQGRGASNAPPYDCPTHPKRDCPPDCPVLQDWWARLAPSLPKPT